jgi:hypothetical protein
MDAPEETRELPNVTILAQETSPDHGDGAVRPNGRVAVFDKAGHELASPLCGSELKGREPST